MTMNTKALALVSAVMLLLAFAVSCSVSVDMPPPNKGDAQVVNIDSLNLRACPSTDCDVLAVLRRGENLKVLQYRNSWTKVWSPALQLEGWAAGKYLHYY
jgi:uncharacterized protein YgiM (DUF1202 family)